MSIENQIRFLGIPIAEWKSHPRSQILLEGTKEAPLRIVEVIDDNHVRYHTQMTVDGKRVPVTFENETPEEINAINIRSGNAFLQRRIFWKPNHI